MAKRLQKGRITYAKDYDLGKIKQDKAFEKAVKQALDRDELMVYYQPIFSVEKGVYNSAEALVRLHDEELGWISPEDFIPIAERNGMIIEMGEVILDKVCRFIHDFKLAQTMVDIGKLAGKPVVAVITSMAQPLGTHIGNALEVKDAIDVLAGRTQGDLLEISLLLGSHMLVLAEKVKTLPEARAMLENALSSGAGLRKLAEMIAAQGGDPRVVEDLSLLPQAAVKRVMRAETAGYLSAMDTTALGMAAQRMGAGRAKKSDMLDYSVGYVLHVRLGDEVTEDTLLATLYARNEAEAEEAEKAIRKALTIAKEKPQTPKLWDAVVTAEGITYNR